MRTQALRLKMDAGAITAIVGAVAAVVAGFLAGFWQWLTSRKKSDTEAQGSIITSFIQLLAEFKQERQMMIARINELEANNQQQDRRIALLERQILKAGLKLPLEEGAKS